MRTLRLSLMGMLTLALLVGLGGVVVAQDPEKATWTHVTGSTVEGDWNEGTGSRWEGSVEYWPTRSQSYTVEWSDPRLPETMHVEQQVVLHHGDMTSPDDSMALWANAARLEGTDGTWSGWERGMGWPDGDLNLVSLTGEGAYEGLSAMLDTEMDWETMVLSFDGFIFESQLPTMPTLVEATED